MNAARQRVFLLGKFQLQPHSRVAILRKIRPEKKKPCFLGLCQIHGAIRLTPRIARQKPAQKAVIEGAQQLPADAAGNHEKTHGQNVEIRPSQMTR